MSTPNIHDFLEKIQQKQDVYDTLVAIRGEKYAKFVRHSYMAAVLARTFDPLTSVIISSAVTELLMDLAQAYNIDLNDTTLSADMIRDVESFGVDLDVKARA